MRALLVVNPKATTTNERSRDVLVRALRSEVDLTVEYTVKRGHAATLTRAAAESGVDVVVTLGGDGTVNEAVNGLMTADSVLSGRTSAPAYRLPARGWSRAARRTSSPARSACPGTGRTGRA
jgi:hypothetical protein